jgi:mono/diheme cytochrome c family protein
MTCPKVLLAVVVLGIGAALVVVYSGVISVAASEPHGALINWLLSTASDESIHYHAKGVEAPPLDREEMVRAGFRHYREMCVGCHLAPGIESSEMREGLMPRPPELKEAAKEWRPAELFWVIKNGIKMTGMPAWGKSHSDGDIWNIVAFLQRLPEMTAEQYKAMDAALGPNEEEGHSHGIR